MASGSKCTSCGRAIESEEIANHTAISFRDALYCSSCKMTVLHEVEAEARGAGRKAPATSRGESGPAGDPSSVFPLSRESSSVTLPPQVVAKTLQRAMPGVGADGRPSSVIQKPESRPTKRSGAAVRPPSGIRPAVGRRSASRHSSVVTSRPGGGRRRALVLVIAILALLGAGGAGIAVYLTKFGGGSSDSDERAQPEARHEIVKTQRKPDKPNPDRPPIVDPKDRVRWHSSFEGAEEYARKRRLELDSKDPNLRADPMEVARDVHDNWKKTVESLAGSPHAVKAKEELDKAAQELEARAQNHFDFNRPRAEKFLAANRFDDAVQVWRRDFPKVLVYAPAWESRLQQEIDQIERRRGEWERERQAQAKDVRKDRPVVDASWLRVEAPTETRLSVKDGAWTIDNRQDAKPLHIPCAASLASGSIHFEMKIDEGYCRLYGPGGHYVQFLGAEFANGRWLDITVLYDSDGKVHAWIKDQPYTLPMEAREPGAGEVALGVPPQSLVQFRGVSIKPDATGASESHEWDILGESSRGPRLMPGGGGVLRREGSAFHCQNPGIEEFVLRTPDPVTGARRLVFEVQGLDSGETIRIGFGVEDSEAGPLPTPGTTPRGDFLTLEGSTLSDPAAWTTIEIEVTEARVEMRVSGAPAGETERKSPRGKIGLFIAPGVECLLQNARLTVE